MENYIDVLPNGKQCPECLEMAVMTAWRPPNGIDPKMREYQCPRCDHTWNAIASVSRKLPADSPQLKAF